MGAPRAAARAAHRWGKKTYFSRKNARVTAQKAQADVLLHRLHYALRGFHRAAQARARADGDFAADPGFDFAGVGPPAH
jgi:hypothetical protein